MTTTTALATRLDLRAVLRLDAVASGTLGLAATARAGVLDTALGLPSNLLLGVGVFLVVYAAGLVALAGRPVMSTLEAAQARSDNPAQPLLIPPLYAALRAKADSIRALRRIPNGQSIDAPLAIQADRTMRYDLLSRVMQTARLAGFRNLTLQVSHVADAGVRSS